MKKNLLYIMLTVLLMTSGGKSLAQTYSDWGLNPNGSVYDTINFVSDTLRFQFSNLAGGAYGQARLVVYFEGDISDNTEVLYVNFAGDTLSSNGPYDSIGVAGPNRVPVNCAAEDSTEFSFSVDTINAYAPSMAIIVIPSANVGVFCTNNRARVRLEYNYCPFGPPVEFASITLNDTVFCSTDAPLALQGTPSGGVYSGIGVNGTDFNPAGLAPGTYTITYTAADSIGCVSSASGSVLVKNTPVVNDTTICVGLPVTLTGSNSSLIWYSDAGLTNPLDTGSTYTTPALYQSTSYYVAFSCSDYYFRIDTLLADSINGVNNNAVVGDDRGGIAVTPQYVYYIADGGGIRYDADSMLNPLGPLPTRDGLFSDLSSGELFSLWNTQTGTEPQNNSTNYTVNALRTLNADLSFGAGITNLSQPINLGNTNYTHNGLFAGAGMLGLYSGNSQHFYVINLCNGEVKDAGFNANPHFRTTESWAVWGLLEYDGNNYSVIYRNDTGNVVIRMGLPADTATVVGSFPAGIADLNCVTYSPWNKNWYYHYEGTSAALGGTGETTGYANAGDSMSVISGGAISCSDEVTVTVNNITTLGPDTTLCQQNYQLVAGLGYSTYTWNGVTNNLNSYTATSTDTVVFEGQYLNGCNHIDTVYITMLANPKVELGVDVTSCGPALLDAGNPGAGYLWSDTSTTQTISAASSGSYTVTVTNSNGCTATDDILVTVNSLPAVSLTLNPTLVCINALPYALTGGTPAGGTWSGTGVSGGSFIPSFAGVGSFVITYTYTDSNGCAASDTQSVVVDPCAGITEPFGNGTVSIIPNPGDGLFNLTISSTDLREFNVEVADLSGKIVYQSNEKYYHGYIRKIDLTNLSDGMYFLKLDASSQSRVIKLVIQK